MSLQKPGFHDWSKFRMEKRGVSGGLGVDQGQTMGGSGVDRGRAGAN